MKPYPAYKPTGLKWLPEVPQHWPLMRGKYIFEKMNRPVRECDEIVTCFRDGQVTLRKNRRTEGFAEALKECGYQGIRKGDLVIHVMDAFAGSIGVSDSDGKGTPVYSVCVPKIKGIDNSYYAHLVRLMAKTGYIQSLYRGIRERSSDFRFDVFGVQFLPIPPPSEQKAIVAYLDAMTAKIDRLIKLKEREIELLQEKKQVVVEDKVSQLRGQEVPLEFIARPYSNCGFNDLPLLSVYLNLGVVRFDSIKDKRANATSEDVSKYQLVKPGDLVMNNQQAWRGSVGVSKLKGIVSPAYVILRLSKDWDMNFANYYFRSRIMVDEYVKASRGVGSIQRNLIWPILKTSHVHVPRLDEQRKIAAYLDTETAKTDKAIDAVARQIALLKEYRTRLISDAVTGRIDLREAVV